MAEENPNIAILFSDVVGYAHVADLEKTVSIVHDEETRDLVRSLTHQHDGDWVHEVGDAVVCTFKSAVTATQCALEIQEGIVQEYQFRPRIGIHTADVGSLAGGTDAGRFADAVNVAAHVQELSERGGICLTGQVYEELRSNQALLDFEDLGQRKLENVDDPVQIYRISLPTESVTLSEFATERARIDATRSRIPTIAIWAAVIIALTVGWLLVRPTPEANVQLADATETDAGETVPDVAALQELSEADARAAAFSAVREKLLSLEGNSDFAARVWTIPDPVKDDTLYQIGVDANCACTALLFAIDGSADEISLLYPNPFHTDASIRAGETLEIPSSDEFSLRAVGGEGIDEILLIVADGPLELGFGSRQAWSATPDQAVRVAELETLFAAMETLEWDSAAAPLQIIP
jgi:class 3 adenylate cyclase